MWCFKGFGKALGDAGSVWRGVFFLRDIKLTSRDANLVTLTQTRDIWHDVLWYHHLLNHYLPRQVAGVIYTTWLVNKWIVHNRLHLLCVCIYVYIHLIKDSSWVSIQTCRDWDWNVEEILNTISDQIMLYKHQGNKFDPPNLRGSIRSYDLPATPVCRV